MFTEILKWVFIETAASYNLQEQAKLLRNLSIANASKMTLKGIWCCLDEFYALNSVEVTFEYV